MIYCVVHEFSMKYYQNLNQVVLEALQAKFTNWFMAFSDKLYLKHSI